MGGEDHHAAPLGVGQKELFEHLDPLLVDGGKGFIEDPECRFL